MNHRKRHSLQLESLESRHLLAGIAFHNFESPLDVNADESVTPADALIVINRLNAPPAGEPEVPSVQFMDVNDDGNISPADVLSVINHLNQEKSAAELPDNASLRLASMMSADGGEESATVDYEKDVDEGVVRQSLRVQIKNAEPETTFQVSIDGKPVGSTHTDDKGNAALTLSTDPSEGEQPLPDDFPAVAEQSAISVGSELNGTLEDINGLTVVDVVGGDLTIRGDHDNNFIFVTQVDHQQYLIVGVNTALQNRDGGEVGRDTLEGELEGVELYYTIATGVRDDFRVHMRGGHDVFVMGGYIDVLGPEAETSDNGEHTQLEVPGRLDIFTEDGDDLVHVGGTRVGEGALINLGQGENALAIGGGGAMAGAVDLDILGELLRLLDGLIDESDGEVVDAVRSVLGQTTVHHTLVVNTFNGDDAVYVGDAYIGDELIMHTRKGHDTVFVGSGTILDIDTLGLGVELEDILRLLDLRAEVYVDGHLFVHTHDGNDLVRLGGVTEASELELGSEPILTPGGLKVGRSAHVYTHRGDDDVLVAVTTSRFQSQSGAESEYDETPGLGYDVRVGHDMHVHTGSGEDRVHIGEDLTTTPDLMPQNIEKVLEVGRSLFIITADGADEVLLRSRERGGVDTAEAENGQNSPHEYDINVGRRLHIDTGSDNDDVGIFGTDQQNSGQSNQDYGVLRTGKDLFIATGSGRDNVLLSGGTDFFDDIYSSDNGYNGWYGISVGHNLFVITGSREDRVFVHRVHVDHLAHLDSGSHNDEMLIDHLYAKYLDAFLGSHDDCFGIANSHGDRRTRAFGGGGYDAYAVSNTNIKLYDFDTEDEDCFDEFLD